MAKGKTQSSAIREYLKDHRRAKAKEVIDALAAKGIKVSAGLVYAVKGKVRGKKRRRLAAAQVATVPSRNGAMIDPVKLVQEVKALAEKAGGFAKLKALLEALQ